MTPRTVMLASSIATSKYSEGNERIRINWIGVPDRDALETIPSSTSRYLQ